MVLGIVDASCDIVLERTGHSEQRQLRRHQSLACKPLKCDASCERMYKETAAVLSCHHSPPPR